MEDGPSAGKGAFRQRARCWPQRLRAIRKLQTSGLVFLISRLSHALFDHGHREDRLLGSVAFHLEEPPIDVIPPPTSRVPWSKICRSWQQPWTSAKPAENGT